VHPLHLFRYCPRCGSARFTAATEKSKRCADCGFEYFLNPSAAVAAFIVNPRDELLVVRRAEEPARGTLDLPGGFCDLGETAEQSIRREMMEETRLTPAAVQPLFSLPNRYEYSGFVVPTMDLFFRCTVADYTALTACDDAAEVMWIPIHSLDPALFGLHSVRRAVERFIAENAQNT